MAPRPEEDEFLINDAETKNSDLPFPKKGEEVVISGISGSFPDSDGMQMFRDKLLNKVDLVSGDDRRWNLDHPEIPQRTGKLYNIEKFDAAFFGVHKKQADVLDPMLRIALERVFEAIADAGVNPRHLHGTRTAVYTGTSFSESEKTWFYDNIEMDGLGVTNCSRGTMANRISYWLGLVGPSYVVDTACSSSLYALERAYNAIRSGQCDSAIVLGGSLCLHPYVSLQFARLGVLAPDGKCKSFDAAANGYTRAEAIPAVFVQKAKDAKRIYARVVHAKTNCDGFKEHGITYPSGQMQLELLKEFYEECKIDPSSVSFVEAHGTGTKVGDPEECNTLDEIFCKGRDGPLLIGSVKSNMGHSEPSSGLCSVAKSIIALESEIIPPNLNFSVPKPSIVGLIEGRIQVVTEPVPLPGDKGLIGINSFGFGGANAHVLLEWNKKKKAKYSYPADGLPRLVLVSGRSIEAINYIFDDIRQRPIDVEFLQLLNELFSSGITGHHHRGFAIFNENGEVSRFARANVELPNQKVTFAFPGLGNQYKGMGKSLLQIPAFAASIDGLQNALNFSNINLRSILTEDSTDCDNIINAVLSVIAIQIGIVDCLASLGVYPSAAIGYSIGEIACAYTVRNLTANQAITTAYYIASALQEKAKSRYATLQIGVDEIKAQSYFSKGVEITSYSGSMSTTIVGPASVLEKMKTMLISLRIPAEEVNTCGIGLHSSHVADIEKDLLQNLQKVIPFSQPKNKAWISYKMEEHGQTYQDCSAQFFTKLISSPIYLAEAKAQIPKDSYILEMGPSGLLRQLIETDSLYLNLLDNQNRNDTIHFFKSLGWLYMYGVQVNLHGLYPSVEYPVSRGTPMIGSLIKWDHEKDWYVPKFCGMKVSQEGETKVVLSLKSEDNTYLHGHMIDGRVLYPATGYVNLVADIMNSRASNMSKEKLLVFEDVKFLRATPLNLDGTFHEFTVSLHKTTGKFEILEGGAIVVTGIVNVYSEDFESHKADPSLLKHTNDSLQDDVIMSSSDIYKELRLRGYNYTGAFRGLDSVEYSGRRGQVKYTTNLVGFMDTMLQIQILNIKSRDLFVPVSIGKIVIDPKAMFYELQKTDPENPVFPINYYKDVNIITAGGVQIWNLRAQQIPRRKPMADPVLEKYAFTPNTIIKKQKEDGELKKMVELMVHLALENLPGIKVKAFEIADKSLPAGSELLSPHIANVLSNLPLIQADVRVVCEEDSVHMNNQLPVTFDATALATEKDCAIITGFLLMETPEVLKKALVSLKPTGFLISREREDFKLDNEEFSVLADYLIAEERFLLLRKKKEPVLQTVVVPVSNDLTWITPLKEAILSSSSKVIVLAEKEKTNGVLGLVNCLTKEPAGEKIRCVFIRDPSAPPFDINLPLYADQLEKDLIMNVYENGSWGSYRHQTLGENAAIPAQHIFVNNRVRGDLSSLDIFQGPHNRLAVSDDLKQRSHVKVHYSSINFKDVLLVSGRIVLPGTLGSSAPIIGLEYSGINEKGEKVMGALPYGAMTSMIVDPDPNLTWKVPEGYTLEEAATLPIVYATVYHAVVVNGRARRGESILIHSAAGGIGIAAINAAIGLGLEIYATVGTQEKRDYLLKNYPQISENHIGNSRDISFEDMIKRETNMRGVDMVLNSLSDEKMEASLRCLAVRGRFLEIGKYDLLNDTHIDLKPFAKNVSYHSCMLDIALEGTEELRAILKADVENVLKSGYLKPLPVTVFDICDPEQAFRYMTTGKHIGKVIMKVQDEAPASNVPKLFNAVPQYFCNEKASYIVIGGLGGFGLELSNWLVSRGAKVLVLTSRSGVRNGYQRSRIQFWQDHNVKVHIATDDISTESGVTNLLNSANKLAPVAGIFNLAVVLKDSVFENQTEETFKTSFCGKSYATELLDKISRTLCPTLEDFVVFSSVSCGRGNAGQSNYGMSNSIMERICEERKKDGLPGLAVQWGAVGEVGLVAEMAETHQELVIGGTLQQTINSCLQCLDVFLNQSAPVVASMVVAEKRSLKGSGTTMVDTVCVILGIRDLKTVSHNTSLSELGMDSMMAVEIKQTLEREFEVFLSAQDLRAMTFAKLAAYDSAASTGSQINTKNANGLGLNVLLSKMQPESEAEQKILKLGIPTVEGTPVFFVPGLDGITTLFSNIAEQIKVPTYGLMYPHKRPDNTSVRKTAEIMLPVIIEHLAGSKEFNLVGHSAGCLVVIELALILESLGYKGKIILIDGTPALFSTLIKGLGIGDTDDEITNAILYALQESIVGESDKVIFDEVTSWDEKITLLENKVMSHSEHRREYLKESTQNLILRLKNIMMYSTDKVIKSPVSLIKPEEITCSEMTTEDFELSKITTEPVDVITVKGNHITMLATSEIAEIISKKLQ